MTLHRVALGNAIKSERIRQNKTLRDVAVETPMALGYLSEIERGHKELSSEFLEKILVALGMSYADLLWSMAMVAEVEEQRQEEYALA